MDDQARRAIRQIAKDITELLIANKDEMKKDAFMGMSLALGRIYEQYTKEDLRIAGPRKIMAWAANIGEPTHKRITLN